MEAVTLPNELIENEEKIRELAITSDRRLIPSIRLEGMVPMVESMLTLNDPKSVQRIQDPTVRNQLLQLHGVPITMNSKLLKEYVVCVFQTRVLLVYRSAEQTTWTPSANKIGPYQRVPVADRSKETKKVHTLAVRALYALGLDYGVVKCGVAAGRKIMVTQVYPSPRCNRDMERVFIQAIIHYVKQLREPKVPLEQITLGADPEFVMQSPKGYLLIASNYFPVHGKIGCDAIWLGQNHADKPLVEIRPDPTPDPLTLIARIYQSLLQATRKMGNVEAKWLAGAMPYKGFPLGGHVHFSGIQPNFKMLRALDNYLALPLVLAEDERGKGRRPKYGFLGDFRYQEHGGFEYRTPPSWLVSPTLTKGVLAAAKVIVANYRQLSASPLTDLALQRAYYTGDKSVIRPSFQMLWEELKMCEDYTTYQAYLDGLYQYVSSGVMWNEAKDFREVWRLPPFHK